MAKNQLVSVIVPTRNSGLTIENCLRSVRDQTYQPIEIFVVDCFSKDQTRKIAEGYSARVIEIWAGRSEARNIGVAKARGKFVFFIDSDMELDVNVVDECIEKIGEGCDAIIVPEVGVGEGFWAKCRALEKACYTRDNDMEAARFFRKRVFAETGGYDNQLEAGEDWDLSQRVGRSGYRIGRTKALIKHNEGRPSLRAAMIKKRAYGKTIAFYRMRNPAEARRQLTPLRPAFARNWRRLARDPLHTFGLFVMKNCEFCAGALTSFNSVKDARNDKSVR